MKHELLTAPAERPPAVLGVLRAFNMLREYHARRRSSRVPSDEPSTGRMLAVFGEFAVRQSSGERRIARNNDTLPFAVHKR
jgi:hypothetical protein